jgi:secreted trypsin-like serine protease
MKYWRTALIALVGTLVLTACGTDLAGAPDEGLVTPSITHGQLDGEGHPFVGLMIAKVDGVPMWRCSGTLLSPTLFLTAGHCTYGATSVEIWFAADIESDLPDPDAGYDGNGYPWTGEVSGTPYTHPDYVDAAFFLADVGVVVLAKPVFTPTYGQLPAENRLETLATRRGKQDTTFTAVGYGLQRINPKFREAERVRMFSTPKLNQINTGLTGTFSLLLSNNASTGGTCFGDSGGPNFLGSGNSRSNVIAGVTSFGLNGNCAGTGGVFRMDRAVVLDWIHGQFGDHLP